MNSEKPILNIKNLKKNFGGISATNVLNMKLYRGRVTGLIGPNGAGKTTAFNLATGFIKPDSGQVFFNETEITGWAPHLISNLGIVRTWQNLRLFNQMSVLDNILLARRNQPGESLFRAFLKPLITKSAEEENKKLAFELLEFVNLSQKKYVFARELSFAEQKLLSIGRIMAVDADCLLLDEPMSGLDGSTLEKAKDLIRNLAVEKNKAVCIIEHNADFIADTCDHILFLDQGSVIAEGTPKEVMSNEHLTNLYFGK